MPLEETFFTVIGCMDGRVQEVVDEYGRHLFQAQFPDTITEAGIVGMLSKNPSDEFINDLKTKITISLTRHGSKGILINGHQECAGDPVDDDTQKSQIQASVKKVQELINSQVPVKGVFVKRSSQHQDLWETEEVR